MYVIVQAGLYVIHHGRHEGERRAIDVIALHLDPAQRKGRLCEVSLVLLVEEVPMRQVQSVEPVGRDGVAVVVVHQVDVSLAL